ncbi:peptidyl-prolyl cis-trans isomerase FKBP4 isoform X2 [Ctenocephalides felis]|uniref:peptidyl-prolyl cis-trans isomerase FKBP4 isoform X2 n=1 Tax=Ctenocephalides felis TaxID=7515 RepID=UPI000E6E5B8C|nr:peptidyl-prolyl cis-trans isomerase FKBP4 isoform X2 [Ctenocephalides felis]
MGAIDITTIKDGGVLKEIIKEGVGTETATPGCKAIVHYTGTLLDGTKFDSSKDRGQPFEFDLGKGQVIKAWDLGVATMKKGEICVLTCQPDYAYGANGSPPTIPPNATLKFEVEMIDWKGEDLSSEKDESIVRLILTPGTGYDTPNDGALVDVKLVGKHEGRTFLEKQLTFNLGEGSDQGVVAGVEKALEKFKKGETSKIILKAKQAYGVKGDESLNIPGGAVVEFFVTLNKFEKVKESWSMDSDEKIEQAKMCKDKGTEYFKNNKLDLAIKKYKKAVDYIKDISDTEGEVEENRKTLLLSSHLNAALCYNKLEDYFSAREQCDSALKIEPNNEKALFRRGQARLSIGEPEKALEDFNAVLKVQPDNKAASNQIVQCQKMMKEQLAKEKKIYANMFDKFARRDTEVKSERGGSEA